MEDETRRTIAPIRARYARLVVTAGNWSDGRTRIPEFAVLGAPAASR